MVDCRNCVVCQNCYSCQGSCYTCEVGYGGDESTQNVEQVQSVDVQQTVEKVEFEDIWHAIYDALDRIAYQLEVMNKKKDEEIILLRQEVELLRSGQRSVGNRPVQRQSRDRGVNVGRRVLQGVEEELKFVPDMIGKVKIRKQLRLD